MPIFGPPDIEKLIQKKNIVGLGKALYYKENQNIRFQAVEGLQKIGGTQAVEVMINALTEKEIQVNIIKALGQMGDKQAIQPICNIILEADNNWLMELAYRVFENLDWQPDIDIISTILFQSNNKSFQLELIKKLSEFGGPKAIEKLRNFIHNPDLESAVVKTTTAYLRDLGWQGDAQEERIKFWLDAGGDDIPNKIARIGPPADKFVIDALENGTNNSRRTALVVLEHLRKSKDYKQRFSSVAEILSGLLKLKDKEITLPIVKILGDIGNEKAIKSLCDIYSYHFSSLGPMDIVCIETLKSIERIGNAAVPYLCEEIKNGTGDHLGELIQVLGYFGDPRAIDTLVLVMKGTNRNKGSASRALLKFSPEDFTLAQLEFLSSLVGGDEVTIMQGGGYFADPAVKSSKGYTVGYPDLVKLAKKELTRRGK